MSSALHLLDSFRTYYQKLEDAVIHANQYATDANILLRRREQLEEYSELLRQVATSS